MNPVRNCREMMRVDSDYAYFSVKCVSNTITRCRLWPAIKIYYSSSCRISSANIASPGISIAIIVIDDDNHDHAIDHLWNERNEWQSIIDHYEIIEIYWNASVSADEENEKLMNILTRWTDFIRHNVLTSYTARYLPARMRRTIRPCRRNRILIMNGPGYALTPIWWSPANELVGNENRWQSWSGILSLICWNGNVLMTELRAFNVEVYLNSQISGNLRAEWNILLLSTADIQYQ
jgi:hypothetical protein